MKGRQSGREKKKKESGGGEGCRPPPTPHPPPPPLRPHGQVRAPSAGNFGLGSQRRPAGRAGGMGKGGRTAHPARPPSGGQDGAAPQSRTPSAACRPPTSPLAAHPPPSPGQRAADSLGSPSARPRGLLRNLPGGSGVRSSAREEGEGRRCRNTICANFFLKSYFFQFKYF